MRRRFTATDDLVLMIGDAIRLQFYRKKGEIKVRIDAPDGVNIYKEKALQKEKADVKSTATTQ